MCETQTIGVLRRNIIADFLKVHGDLGEGLSYYDIIDLTELMPMVERNQIDSALSLTVRCHTEFIKDTFDTYNLNERLSFKQYVSLNDCLSKLEYLLSSYIYQ